MTSRDPGGVVKGGAPAKTLLKEPTIFKGTLLLDCEHEGGDGHLAANVTRAALGATNLILDFEGHDRIRGPFTGTCFLIRSGALLKGVGEVGYGKGLRKATIRVTGRESPAYLRLEGSWRDIGVPLAYDLYINLYPAGSH